MERSEWTRAEREKHPLRPGYKRNPGSQPRGTKGRRVSVALMDGEIAGEWAADSAKWTFRGQWFDIDQYKVT